MPTVEDVWINIQSSRFLSILGISALLFVVGILGRHLQSPETRFKRTYWYGGVDLALGALTSSALYLAQPGTKDDSVNVVFLVIVLVFFMALMSLTKSVLPPDGSTATSKKDIFWLGIIGNLVGLALLAASVWFTLPAS